MGLEPYLLASSVLGIAAQRLVRRICQFCRKPFPTPPGAAHFFPDALPGSLYRGVGCKDCRGTGFHGRIGVFELARMTDNFRNLVLERASEQRLLDAARHGGMRTLREECLARVVEGQTTLEEVVRVTQERN
jgi:type II secretory ATPase GspE/PulE/Tfp pilus assembly ATPase PilB-like protein